MNNLLFSRQLWCSDCRSFAQIYCFNWPFTCTQYNTKLIAHFNLGITLCIYSLIHRLLKSYHIQSNCRNETLNCLNFHLFVLPVLFLELPHYYFWIRYHFFFIIFARKQNIQILVIFADIHQVIVRNIQLNSLNWCFFSLGEHYILLEFDFLVRWRIFG